MDWIMNHMEDADIHDDVTALLAEKSRGGGGAAAEGTATPAAMEQLAARLHRAAVPLCTQGYQGDLQRAMDGSAHEGEDLEAAADAAVSGGGGGGAGGKEGAPEIGAAGEGKYRLMAQVSHLGPNMDHGHYVCHVKKGDKWALFDDDRVAHSPTPPNDKVYMCLYEKLP